MDGGLPKLKPTNVRDCTREENVMIILQALIIPETAVATKRRDQSIDSGEEHLEAIR